MAGTVRKASSICEFRIIKSMFIYYHDHQFNLFFSQYEFSDMIPLSKTLIPTISIKYNFK